jgi:hypothetical protein
MQEAHLPPDNHHPPHAEGTPSRQAVLPQATDTIEIAEQKSPRSYRLVRMAGSQSIQLPARRRDDALSLASNESRGCRSRVDILLIDDSAADVALFRRALKQCGLGGEVTLLRQGSEVEAFVRQAALMPPQFSPFRGRFLSRQTHLGSSSLCVILFKLRPWFRFKAATREAVLIE